MDARLCSERWSNLLTMGQLKAMLELAAQASYRAIKGFAQAVADKCS